jgi:hypothetical protein
VDDKLCRGRVQVDGVGARNQVKEGGGLRVEDRRLDCFHGDKSNVVEGVSLNALN